MNKIIFALPITALFLVFMGVSAQMNFAEEESNLSNTANNNKEEADKTDAFNANLETVPL